MASNITLRNNFSAYKEDFTKDISLTFNQQNMNTYIQYYHARSADASAQLLAGLVTNMANDLAHLPEQVKMQIAQMISSHETIKQLLNKKS